MHYAFLLLPAYLPPTFPSTLAMNTIPIIFLSNFFFSQSSPTVSSRMSWAANQPTRMENHPKLRAWGQYDWDMKQVVCAALPLLSEVPITQGQAQAGGKPSHSVGVQLWEQPVPVTSKTTGTKYKNKFSSSQSLPRGKKLFPVILKEDSPFIVFQSALNQRHTAWLKFLYCLAVFDETSLLCNALSYPQCLADALLELCFQGMGVRQSYSESHFCFKTCASPKT